MCIVNCAKCQRQRMVCRGVPRSLWRSPYFFVLVLATSSREYPFLLYADIELLFALRRSNILFVLASSFFVQFLSTWMVPSFAPVEMANGSVTSCTVQAYFGYLFYGLSAFSNASLAASCEYEILMKLVYSWCIILYFSHQISHVFCFHIQTASLLSLGGKTTIKIDIDWPLQLFHLSVQW